MRRVVLIVALVLACAGRAQAAVAVGTGTPTRSLTPATGTGGTSASWTISGSNLAIVVSVSINTTVNDPTISPSWSLGSGTPVFVQTSFNPDSRESIWVIPNATAGTGTYAVTLSASAPYQITATYFSGTDPTTPCPAADAATSTTASTSVTVTPANLTASDASYGGSATLNNNPTSVTPNQTFLDATTTVNAEAGYATGTTGVTFNYDNATTTPSRVAVRVVAAAGGGPTCRSTLGLLGVSQCGH